MSGHVMTKAQYAAAVLPFCELIVGAVHCDGPDELLDAIRRARTVPAPPGVDPNIALITIVAAMVDPDKATSETLAWVKALSEVRMTLRAVDSPAEPDETAVELACTGQLAERKLHPVERREAIRRMRVEKLPYAEIARRANTS